MDIKKLSDGVDNILGQVYAQIVDRIAQIRSNSKVVLKLTKTRTVPLLQSTGS